ncbi:MAG: phosphatase PAP2 family protein [Zoogloea sp.]|nr:phosphatase PAP2 family protein [Zoogloea sp.]
MPRHAFEYLERLLEWDRACVLALNRILIYRPCSVLARWISRLGDGELWLGLVVVLALLPGPIGTRCALHLAGASVPAVLIYKLLKSCTGRPRPYVRLAGIRLCVRPLDEFSFPSGHVLHAVAIAVIATAYFPGLGLVLVPFAVLTALVRIVLGLHYPSDVLAGVAVGGTVAAVSLLTVRAVG